MSCSYYMILSLALRELDSHIASVSKSSKISAGRIYDYTDWVNNVRILCKLNIHINCDTSQLYEHKLPDMVDKYSN